MTEVVLSRSQLAEIDRYLRDHGWVKFGSGNFSHPRLGLARFTNLEALEWSMRWDREEA